VFSFFKHIVLFDLFFCVSQAHCSSFCGFQVVFYFFQTLVWFSWAPCMSFK
jgi:hypothetical protein